MKKKFCIVGIIASALIILLGILTIAGVLGGDTSTASSASNMYDSGYASFGGDFYSYVNNNAQEAASASRTVAKNLDQISDLLKNVIGFGFIFFGVICGCGFGIAMSSCDKKNEKGVSVQPTEEIAPVASEDKADEEEIAPVASEDKADEGEIAPVASEDKADEGEIAPVAPEIKADEGEKQDLPSEE